MNDRPPFETMTTQEYADWCARDDGWKTVAVTMSGCDSTDDAAKARVFQWKRGNVVTFDHPFPLTLDAAAEAMPKGRTFIRVCRLGGRYEWASQKYHGINDVWVTDTGDEIHDRFWLACECVWTNKSSQV